MAGKKRHYRILSVDPWLRPYEQAIDARMARYQAKRTRLVGEGGDLSAFANGHLYYGIHRTETGWVYREWAPGAEEMHFFGDFNGWNRTLHPMKRLENGGWEIELPGRDALHEGQRVLVQVTRAGKRLDRIPAYIRRVEQDKTTFQFNGVVTEEGKYVWHDEKRAKTRPSPMLIYECHIGMAREDGKIGSYDDFIENVLPRIKKDGYNTVQLMAVQEHPYYASFGYQVTSLFAASSWYGEPDGLKRLIDAAHGMGLRVLLDLVHSHTALNEREGVSNFDGSGACYCRGTHPAWGSALFDYGRDEVIHFLLSNIKFWLEEYHFDGFRFDGVTSMLYFDHGLERVFGSYDDYFTPNLNQDAMTYLQLATELMHTVNPNAVAICEEMSGMPGMCLPISWGGVGFDYRLNMGVPDLWIRLIKEVPDQDWDLGRLWYELTTRRPGEKTVGYAESHDQALVGDKTIIFRLIDAQMYEGMNRACHSPVIDRGIALHKMIRLITLTLAGDAYLNFMGNEFGHPEWIDFPREGNGWSGQYARRQWSLSENGFLKYEQLGDFDKAMLTLVKREKVLSDREAKNLWMDRTRKVMVYERGGVVFLFNFHPEASYPDFEVRNLDAGDYRAALDTDALRFGGFGRVEEGRVYTAAPCQAKCGFAIYLPARTAIALVPVSMSKGHKKLQ